MLPPLFWIFGWLSHADWFSSNFKIMAVIDAKLHIYTQSEKTFLPEMETIVESLSNLGRQGTCHVITNCFSLVWGQIGNCHKFLYIYLTNISVSFTILHISIIWYFQFYIYEVNDISQRWKLTPIVISSIRIVVQRGLSSFLATSLLSGHLKANCLWVTWPKNVTLIKGYIGLMCLLLTGLHCTCQASNF